MLLLIFVVDEIKLLFKLFVNVEILLLILLNPETTLVFIDVVLEIKFKLKLLDCVDALFNNKFILSISSFRLLNPLITSN